MLVHQTQHEIHCFNRVHLGKQLAENPDPVALVRRIEKNDFEGRTLTLKVKFLDFQQITRSITVDHILRTKDEILPLAKQLMQQVEFHSHPIRLLGLGVSNQKIATPQEENQWIELELEFEPWPEK